MNLLGRLIDETYPHRDDAGNARRPTPSPDGGGGATRESHMQLCKRRAIEIAESGDVQGAFASMASDLGKHPETADHMGIELGMMQLMGGMLNTPAQMKKFIEDFN